jgi:hypothetical protein
VQSLNPLSSQRKWDRRKEVAKAMYVTVRRYEGVTDPRKVGQLVDEGFVPIINEIP